MRKPLLISLLALASISLLTGCGSDDKAETTVDAKPPQVSTLVGDWEQSNTEETGVRMSASVNSDDSIQIRMLSRDSSGIYWMGSFQISDKSPDDAFKIESKADPDAQKWMRESIFGSQDTTKIFAYKNGEISYDFTMMGVTSTVRLVKSS
ncbi:hypothetical protein SEA_MADAMATO_47 [Streptomyces phage Madamato]|nr:hypothetical protein SEA_MADAMATO_47 [Streptomyces phage Madamato]